MQKVSPSPTTQIPGNGNRASRIHWLPLVLALLPSLLLFIFPIYEEDFPAHVYGPPWPTWAWLQKGRLLWRPIYDGMRMVMPGLPEACFPLACLYTGIFAAFLLLLARFFTTLLGGRLRGAMAAALISMHFFFYEGRIWNGHNMLAAAALGLAGVVIAERATQQNRRWRTLFAVVSVAFCTFLAFNAHQAGAMVVLSLVGLTVARNILDGRSIPRNWRAPAVLCGGFALGCIAYAIQMAISISLVGADSRVSIGGWLPAAGRFLKITPQWASLPIPVLANLAPKATYAAFGVLAVLAIWVARRVPLRRRLAAACVVLLTALATYAPTVLTDGYPSCRVLTPALIAIWGGGCLFLVTSRSTRVMRIAWGVLIALFLTHLWGFGLLVAIKSCDRNWTKRLHRELADRKIEPGYVARFHSVPFEPDSIRWADLGRSLYDTAWGVDHMLKRRSFSSPDPLPPDIRWQFGLYPVSPPPLEHPAEMRFVQRLSDGSALVWLPMINASCYALEQRFIHPWTSHTTYPIHTLWKWGAQQYAPGSAAWCEDSLLRICLPPNGTWRVYFRAIELNRPWHLRIKTRLHNTTGPYTVRFGMRDREGHDHVLDTEYLCDGHAKRKMRENGPARPGDLAWLEVQSRSDHHGEVRIKGRGLILE